MWARFWGLMFRGSLAEGEALLITPCSSVHTIFMRFPIDVVFLDKDERVVKVVTAMKPYGAALGGHGAHHVLELNAGAAATAGLTVGNSLVFAETLPS